MFSFCLCQILTLPFECLSRNPDSSDQATFFQSSTVQYEISLVMERIWLGVWVLSECVVLPTCLLSHYYFVGQRLSWTEAQTYCRQTHTDLATIRNYEEVNQLTSTLSSAGYFSDVWIGLYNEIDWQWSDGFTGTGTDYRDWSTENYQPNFYAGSEFCVVMGYTGQWWDVDCTERFPVFCYKGNHTKQEFSFLPKLLCCG
ncbi:snaclec alboaggregin-D subunit beta-like [Nothobranchius furzeri]|uniref:snaclec alboaggregin-D subunit beta-like n=1 Tax=Nothobranchius furzeri TaxID=105023 RepID=UPI003904A00D